MKTTNRDIIFQNTSNIFIQVKVLFQIDNSMKNKIISEGVSILELLVFMSKQFKNKQILFHN